MLIIALALVAWYLGNALMKMADAGQSVFDYWVIKEKKRINKEYEDNCE